MECEFSYCIYNSANKCLLNNIKINVVGMCEECIIVSIDEKILDKQKQNQLENLE